MGGHSGKAFTSNSIFENLYLVGIDSSVCLRGKEYYPHERTGFVEMQSYQMRMIFGLQIIIPRG